MSERTDKRPPKEATEALNTRVSTHVSQKVDELLEKERKAKPGYSISRADIVRHLVMKGLGIEA